MSSQTLTCRNCNSTWTRAAQAGRPPVYCADCRMLGQALTTTVAPIRPQTVAPKTTGHHYAFKTLLAVAKARIPAMLVGPAGSGKTTAAKQVAKALGLRCSSESCNPQMTKYDLLGFVNATGSYSPGVVRDPFENGGVLLLDEIDASNPAILVSLNMLASVAVGETVTFPDGTDVPRHADFILIAGGNTYGDGASDEYVGREQLDAATLDRFACISWGYDEDLEFHAAGPDAAEWVHFVQRVRKVAQENKISLLVTPRASIMGAALLRDGMSRTDVERLTVYKGIDDDTKRTLLSAVKASYRISAESKGMDSRVTIEPLAALKANFDF